jgi:hypothetical protein
MNVDALWIFKDIGHMQDIIEPQKQDTGDERNLRDNTFQLLLFLV